MKGVTVTRYFDDANRLLTATDFDLGSSSYTYDNNGNLTLIVLPGEEDRQHYAFNQRNLMINHALSTNGTNLQTQATFGYDGAGNRLQQVDYTGGTPAATTYANDIQGLTQVLLADNGTSQTANLFGFNLIHQQNNQQSDPLFLLTDGLGSVRQEVSADAVAATTTYDPYGNVFNQSGESKAG
jgi:YD repeat-containing protein